MRRLPYVAVTLLVAASILAIATTAAFAILGEETTETSEGAPLQKDTWTLEAPSAFEGSVVSTEQEIEFAPTSKKLEDYHRMLKGVKCKNPLLGTATGESLGDAAGIVLQLGELHWVDANLALILWNPVHLECLYSSGTVLLIVSGANLGKVSPTNSKTKRFSLELKGSKGKQTNVTEYENNSGEKVIPKLEASSSLGSEGAASENDSSDISLETERETELT
ncbi:MAG TPA: hypothetical protein VGY13_06220 [Solirubrobacteraceae bacterium]|jgi:hypothetical protein|nr:hypothetical protein [Solirubrobacteraceae bacterium]